MSNFLVILFFHSHERSAEIYICPLFTSALTGTVDRSKRTNQVNNQRHKYHPLTAQYHNDSEDDYRSGCRNVSHCHEQFFSELHLPRRSH